MTDFSGPKRVLVPYYTQTGQLHRVLESLVQPLVDAPEVAVDFVRLEPVDDYPFPWPFIRFINTFPECAHEVGCELKPLALDSRQRYDLVILGYQVWYLAPSIPVVGFLRSPEAESLLRDTPVVTVIACRNMWLMAQEKVKKHLQRLGARLVGNVALVDAAGSFASFFATPLWVLSGNKGPFPLGIPAAGVSERDIADARRFGEAIVTKLNAGQPLDDTLLRGLGAVRINEKLIASEKVASRSFYLWGKLFRSLGGPDAFWRKPLAVLYSVFLVLMLITVVPITALLKWLLGPLMRDRIKRQKQYYALPSGEADDARNSSQLDTDI